MAARSWWVTALIALTAGCSAALTPLTSEQTTGLKEAQRIADRVTKAYGVPGVRVYATSGLSPGAGAAYSYRQDWIFIHPRLLTGNGFMYVISHELGHVTLGHRPVDLPTEKLRAVIADKERAANHRGVEILVRFLGLTEREALERYATYLIAANRSRNGRNVLIPFGHPLPCVQLRDLWASFGQTAPACELQAAPDDSAAVTPDDRLR